ncbi:MAG: hydrolase family protein [Polaromonas sp.]|jgi:2,4-diketo-3-deoxy-L-fuconate hydrolase|nr:hydrolase family protein [Polaromonas sp.]
MKLLRYGPLGQEKPGALDADGNIRDLSSVVTDIGADVLGPEKLARLAKLDLSSLPIVPGRPRLGQPVAQIGKFLAIGLNYKDHAAESNMPEPGEPVIFMKAISCLAGPHDNVIVPRNSLKMDWEAEIGIVIGSKCQYVTEAEALDHVAGYCVVNDVSERHFQLERGGTLDKGKSFDTLGPVGPWLVTRDEVGDVQALDIWLELNGERMQDGNTRNMIFSCARIVSYLSELMTLMPGDIITTGTPAGVGMGMKPPRFLKKGDVMTLGVQKLGEQRQTVAA